MEKLLCLGTDTEFFVQKNSHVCSAIGLLHGSKSEPFVVKDGNLQEDNVLAEMAVDPCKDVTEWIEKIASVKNDLRLSLSFTGHTTVCKSSHHFTKDQLLGYGSMAMEMGCSPDYNVYEKEVNKKPSAKTTLRTAAGHIHFSYENNTDEATASIVKCLDVTLGVWSVLNDSDKYRRDLYGKAGCCRIKPYGGEYRTLGNFWIDSEAMQRYVWQVTAACVEHHEALLPVLRTIASGAVIQGIINKSDIEQATLLYPSIERILIRAWNLDSEEDANEHVA